jgi:hypothetical protein
VGLITGVPLDYLRFGKGRAQWLALGALIAIPLLCVGGVLFSFRYTGEIIRGAEMWSTAADYYNQNVLPLLRQRRSDRAPDKVQRSTEVLSEKLATLTESTQRLEALPPYWNPVVNEERRRIEAQLKALMDTYREALQELRWNQFRGDIRQTRNG